MVDNIGLIPDTSCKPRVAERDVSQGRSHKTACRPVIRMIVVRVGRKDQVRMELLDLPLVVGQDFFPSVDSAARVSCCRSRANALSTAGVTRIRR
jgi:hypothetical protein